MNRKDTGYKGPRPIDLDILFYDDLILNDEKLKIPHEGILERDFVLKPLLDINKFLVHPLNKKPIFKLYEELENNPNLVKTSPKKVLAIPKLNNDELIIDLEKEALSVGIMNITPNSFYENSRYLKEEENSINYSKIKRNAKYFDIIDIGAEATNPKSSCIPAKEEIERLLQVFKYFKKEEDLSNLIVSLDTRKVF